MKRLFLVLFFVVLVGCSPTSLATSTVPRPTATPGSYALHQVVSVPGWQITVYQVWETGTDAGQILLVVDLTLHNLGKRAAAPPAFTLTSNGEREGPGTKPGGITPFPSRIPAGRSLDGSLAWTVPITATRFTLAYQSLAIWPLSIT